MTTAALNTKGIDIEIKILDNTYLATTAALNTKVTEVESIIPGTTNLVTKAALITKSAEIKNETADTTGFITTPEFNGLTKVSFDARMKEATKNLASKDLVDALINAADKKRQKIKKT